ncbi:hypothetical protein ACTXT7_014063 [Hymenolepis weldensis]
MEHSALMYVASAFELACEVASLAYLHFLRSVYTYAQAYLLLMNRKYPDEAFKCSDVVGKEVY